MENLGIENHVRSWKIIFDQITEKEALANLSEIFKEIPKTFDKDLLISLMRALFFDNFFFKGEITKSISTYRQLQRISENFELSEDEKEELEEYFDAIKKHIWDIPSTRKRRPLNILRRRRGC